MRSAISHPEFWHLCHIQQCVTYCYRVSSGRRTAGDLFVRTKAKCVTLNPLVLLPEFSRDAGHVLLWTPQRVVSLMPQGTYFGQHDAGGRR